MGVVPVAPPTLIGRAAGLAARLLVTLVLVFAVAMLAFFPGDVVVVTPEPSTSLRVGQVITYNIPNGNHEPVTHRVIAILHGGRNPVIRTRGDANAAPDPWTARLAGPTVWRQRWTIPAAGWVIEWLRQPSARYPLAIGLPLLLCLLWLREIWSDGSEPTRHAPDPA